MLFGCSVRDALLLSHSLTSFQARSRSCRAQDPCCLEGKGRALAGGPITLAPALAMLAPRFFLSPVAVIEPSVAPTGEHMFPLPILKLQVRRLVGLPSTQPWLSTRMDHRFDFLNV